MHDMKMNGLDIETRDEPAWYEYIEGHGRVCTLGGRCIVERATVEDAGAFLCALDESEIDRRCLAKGWPIPETYNDETANMALVRALFSDEWIREQAEEWANDR